MDDNKILLVNLNYDSNDRDNIMYSVPTGQMETAQTAVQTGCERWTVSGVQEHRTIEDFIHEELKKAGVRFEPMEFESIEVNCDGF